MTASSVSERTIMWKRIGKVFPTKPATAEEAIVEGGLDWNVEVRPLSFASAEGHTTAPGHFATVRTDTEKMLGAVKSKYQVFNNREAFAFADNLVDGAGASFESAWSTNGGKVVGLTMKLPNTVTVGGKDVFDQYLALRTSHDGSSAIGVAIMNVRMSCLNQFNLNFAKATRKWSVNHTSSASGKLQQAREALELAFTYNDAFEEEMERLLNTEIPSHLICAARINRVLIGQHCSESASAGITDAILANLANSETIADEDRNNAYGLINATTEYFDHIRDYRTGESAFKVTTEGLGARTAQALTNQLLATAGV